MPSATIKDVAKRAGVGLGTVSRVLNNHPRVSAHTRERVLRAMAELNFRPNPTARRLSRKNTLKYIGVILHPFVINYHSIAERLRGIQQALSTYDDSYEIVLFNVSSAEHFDAQLTNIINKSDVQGLLIIDLNLTTEQEALLRSAGVPFVGLNNHLRNRTWNCFGTDDHQGAYLATKHLVSLGHRRIAYIGDNLFDIHGFPTSQTRYAGYAQALNEAGIHLNNRYVKLGEHSHRAAEELTADLFNLAQPPSAIFAMSDLQAMGSIVTLRNMGLQVPQDVSVVGYDDVEMSYLTGLTTVRQHLELGGKIGVNYLIALIEGNLPTTEQLPPVEIIIRATTASPIKG